MPDQYHVTMSPRAKSDLDEIYNYIAKDSPQNAKTFTAELVEAIASLQMLPHGYRIHQGRHRPSGVIRRMPVPPYLVYYSVDDIQRRTEVITIRHGKRRQPRNLTRT
jgi:toxin ParE1/3/4